MNEITLLRHLEIKKLLPLKIDILLYLVYRSFNNCFYFSATVLLKLTDRWAAKPVG